MLLYIFQLDYQIYKAQNVTKKQTQRKKSDNWEVVGKSRFISLHCFICPLSSLMYIIFKCPVEFSLSDVLGINFLFVIENKYLIHLTLNHMVFDENQTCFVLSLCLTIFPLPCNKINGFFSAPFCHFLRVLSSIVLTILFAN